MTTQQTRDHSRPSNAPDPIIQGTSQTAAEEARTILAGFRYGTLSTQALQPSGFPYGSIVNYALDAQGRPLLLTSDLAEHTANFKADPRGSLLVSEAEDTEDDPLTVGRVTLLGIIREVPSEEARGPYLHRHPQATYYADFKDFHFYRIEIEALRYIGGFGRMSWVDAAAYCAAEADPIYPFRRDILQHCNNDHSDALLLLCRHVGLKDASKVIMTSVDRYGFDMTATTPEAPRLVRLGFPEAARTPDQVRQSLIAMITEARAQ